VRVLLVPLVFVIRGTLLMLSTHTPWTYTVIDPGTYLWTSPHGYQFLRDRHGTTDVSRDRPPPRAPDPPLG
jgi:hypothetical protein